MNKTISYIGPERRSGKVALSKHRAWEVLDSFERAHDELALKRGSVRGMLVGWFTSFFGLKSSRVSKLCRFRKTDNMDDITGLFLRSSEVCERDVIGSLGEGMQEDVQSEFRIVRGEILGDIGGILARSGVGGSSDEAVAVKKEISASR